MQLGGRARPHLAEAGQRPRRPPRPARRPPRRLPAAARDHLLRRDQAVVDGHDLRRAPLVHGQRAVAHREPGAGPPAQAVLVSRAPAWTSPSQGMVVEAEPADPGQAVRDHVGLQPALRGQRDVLEVAAAAARRGRCTGRADGPGRGWAGAPRSGPRRPAGRPCARCAPRAVPTSSGSACRRKTVGPRGPIPRRPRRSSLPRGPARAAATSIRSPGAITALGSARGAGGPDGQASLVPHLPGHRHHDDVRQFHQAALEADRRLVVQQLLPPVGDHVLGHVDREEAVRRPPPAAAARRR